MSGPSFFVIILFTAISVLVINRVHHFRKWKRAHHEWSEEKKNWAEEPVWGLQVQGDHLLFFVRDDYYGTGRASVDCLLRDYINYYRDYISLNDANLSRVRFALDYCQVRPHCLTEHKVTGETGFVLRMFLPLPEAFDSHRLGGWFYVRGAPHFNFTAPPLPLLLNHGPRTLRKWDAPSRTPGVCYNETPPARKDF